MWKKGISKGKKRKIERKGEKTKVGERKIRVKGKRERKNNRVKEKLKVK